MVRQVVSWPPWVVAVETMTPAGLPSRAPWSPEFHGAVEVLLHLGAHVAETGGGAEDDAVGGPQIIHSRNGDVLLLGQHFLGVFAALEFGEIGIQFLDPAQDHFRPCHRLGPFGRGPGQLQHVAVHGVIHYQDFHVVPSSEEIYFKVLPPRFTTLGAGSGATSPLLIPISDRWAIFVGGDLCVPP